MSKDMLFDEQFDEERQPEITAGIPDGFEAFREYMRSRKMSNDNVTIADSYRFVVTVNSNGTEKKLYLNKRITDILVGKYEQYYFSEDKDGLDIHWLWDMDAITSRYADQETFFKYCMVDGDLVEMHIENAKTGEEVPIVWNSNDFQNCISEIYDRNIKEHIFRLGTIRQNQLIEGRQIYNRLFELINRYPNQAREILEKMGEDKEKINKAFELEIYQNILDSDATGEVKKQIRERLEKMDNVTIPYLVFRQLYIRLSNMKVAENSFFLTRLYKGQLSIFDFEKKKFVIDPTGLNTTPVNELDEFTLLFSDGDELESHNPSFMENVIEYDGGEEKPQYALRNLYMINGEKKSRVLPVLFGTPINKYNVSSLMKTIDGFGIYNPTSIIINEGPKDYEKNRILKDTSMLVFELVKMWLESNPDEEEVDRLHVTSSKNSPQFTVSSTLDMDKIADYVLFRPIILSVADTMKEQKQNIEKKDTQGEQRLIKSVEIFGKPVARSSERRGSAADPASEQND